MSNRTLLYEGKAKKVFQTTKSNEVFVDFKDSLTAFNAEKKGSFENKGGINRDIASLIFKVLLKRGIKSHWIQDEGSTGMLVHRLKIIPLEVVVRNKVAGSLAKKLGRTEGELLRQPLVEFYYKDDALGDPFLSLDQALAFEFVDASDAEFLKRQALMINQVLKELFLKIGIELVDFKIEFGKTSEGKILLADEITPDCCRLWDLKSGEKLDKDRFRRDLGHIKESYVEVLNRLKGAVNDSDRS